jgi:hypothetical protein
MKKTLLLSFIGALLSIIFSDQSSAQGDKISLQITRDGKVVTDTSFQLKEGQDPEAVKKIIFHVLEGDQKMVWVTSEDVDIEMDSVIKHEEKGMVSGEDEGEGHHKVIVRKGSDGEETVIVRSGDECEISEEEGEGSKIIIITEKGDKESEGHQKHLKVIVEGNDNVEILDNEDLEWVEENNADNVDVYVIKKGDGTEVVKKMKVEVKVDEENDNGNSEAAPPEKMEPPKPEKKKK